MSIDPVSKRVFLTLPDVVYQDLEKWADSQGRPIANLGAFLIETAIRQARVTGEFPKDEEKGKKLDEP